MTAPAPSERPAIVVTPYDRETETAYILATASDAFCYSLKNDYVRRDVVRQLMGALHERSERTMVAKFDDDPEVVLGFAIWAPGNMLELVYLRQSLANAKCERCGGDHPSHHRGASNASHGYVKMMEPNAVARDVLSALLGRSNFVRMRRPPPQEWTWRTLHLQGYMPSIVPEAL